MSSSPVRPDAATPTFDHVFYELEETARLRLNIQVKEEPERSPVGPENETAKVLFEEPGSSTRSSQTATGDAAVKLDETNTMSKVEPLPHVKIEDMESSPPRPPGDDDGDASCEEISPPNTGRKPCLPAVKLEEPTITSKVQPLPQVKIEDLESSPPRPPGDDDGDASCEEIPPPNTVRRAAPRLTPTRTPARPSLVEDRSSPPRTPAVPSLVEEHHRLLELLLRLLPFTQEKLNLIRKLLGGTVMEALDFPGIQTMTWIVQLGAFLVELTATLATQAQPQNNTTVSPNASQGRRKRPRVDDAARPASTPVSQQPHGPSRAAQKWTPGRYSGAVPNKLPVRRRTFVVPKFTPENAPSEQQPNTSKQP